MNGLHGIIFAYEKAPGLRELTEARMPGSVPFGGRYRVVDFMLSNMAGAGITDVGVVLHGNYQSLLDHIGSGKTWDMARKNGGLKLLPPFADARKFGVEEFRVNGRGVLRFNPADPNLYHRFFAAGAELDGYDAALTKALAALDGDEQQRAAAGLALLNEYDGKIKKLLTGIFGAENDFDAILGGVNLAGVGANGKRVVQNLLEALTPILREGAERRLTAAADAAAARADAARAERGTV